MGSFSCYLVGQGSLVVRGCELLLSRGHNVLGIVTTDPQVRDWCSTTTIAVITKAEAQDVLSQRPFDYLFSISNLAKIETEILDLPQKAAINYHDGPLPEYAGVNATTWALLKREKRHAVTWHLMTDRLDGGDVLVRSEFSISENETAFTLNGKCFEHAYASFDRLIGDLASGKCNRKAQKQTSHSEYHGPCDKPSPGCIIDWNQPAGAIEAMSRSLDFGSYTNPIGLPKFTVGNRVLMAGWVEVLPSRSGAEAGTITGWDSTTIRIATHTEDVAVNDLYGLDGRPVSPLALFSETTEASASIMPMDINRKCALQALERRVCRDESFWLERLGGLTEPTLPYRNTLPESGGPDDYGRRVIGFEKPYSQESPSADMAPDEHLAFLWLLFTARVSGGPAFNVWYSTQQTRNLVGDWMDLFHPQIPIRLDLEPTGSIESNRRRVAEELTLASQHTTFSMDLPLRYNMEEQLPGLWSHKRMALYRVAHGESVEAPCAELNVVIPEGGNSLELVFDRALYRPQSIDRMLRHFRAFCDACRARERNVHEIPLLPDDERQKLFNDWNDTAVGVDDTACIHSHFEEWAATHPEHIALECDGQSVTYGQLDAMANQVANRLLHAGVAPENAIGLLLDRSVEMVAGLLGILKAGGAYVPLDPEYPGERIKYILGDAHAPVILTSKRYEAELPESDAVTVYIEEIFESGDATRPAISVQPEQLAYLIYTSGSTGLPKGVMVEHRNVINFFTGMDAHISSELPGIWLAATSISFDISVLELFWTLARGFTVVLYTGSTRDAMTNSAATNVPMNFSLFFFPVGHGDEPTTDYELLMESAKYADEHRFEAVWTPERHFHGFGGQYPNPSVISAAIAAATHNVNIRAGSCVLPLHHPIRIAEEWAVVDNISGGRVGLAFASGWQPDDFALAPDNYAHRHELLYSGIEQIRKLWRGDSVAFPGPDGAAVDIKSFPRPVQSEMPIWVTAAGNPETFRSAGRIGANLLTHLLGQSIEEVAEKVAIYREERRAAGHAGPGRVTLMLHTLVGESDEEVRQQVRGPLKEYLRSAAGLVKRYASSFPTFKNQGSEKDVNELFQKLSDRELEAILEHAFSRYFEEAGLFGSIERCYEIANRLNDVGVDEIACLIDFGVPHEEIIRQLPKLNELKMAVNAGVSSSGTRESIPELFQNYGVTHFQCTPSMARMLLATADGRESLEQLEHLLVGGEALPDDLHRDLRTCVSGRISNMYGPTETTIWSTTCLLADSEEQTPIGRPLANTECYVLDEYRQPVPIGAVGELYIGGKGVVRGYWQRPRLTEERFVSNPFRHSPSQRLYRTGDLVWYRDDGQLMFVGRADGQFKLRGHRIEPGEIESALRNHPGVMNAAVSLDEEGKTLKAYLVTSGECPDIEALQGHLGKQLPDFMIPSSFVRLEELPLTPNGKIDRNALLAVQGEILDSQKVNNTFTPAEEAVSEIWQKILRKDNFGATDNFFRIGGDSLGAIQLSAALSERFRVDVPLETVFQNPTITGLADAIANIDFHSEQRADVSEG